MKKKPEEIIWACDFETYVPKNDEDFTFVWSAAFVPLFEEGDNVRIVSNIEEFLNIFLTDEDDSHQHTLYFHNLKFDGSFIVDFLLKHGYQHSQENPLLDNQFQCVISGMGSWYAINIQSSTTYISIRDSLKLLPFSLKQIGHDFELVHQKTTMDYFDKTSLDDCSPSDIEYIKEDVLVLREALEGILTSPIRGLTIGSMCMKDYKLRFFKKFGRSMWDAFFPNLTENQLPNGMNEDSFVRKSYRGGVCYAYRMGYFKNGMTYDKVSMYPGVMKKYKLPYGEGTYFTNNIPFFEMYNCDFGMDYNLETFDWEIAHNSDFFFFVHVRCNFDLKLGFIPTLQIKNNPLYFANDYLTTSAIDYNGKKYKHYIKDGKIVPTSVDLYLTQYDLELLLKHYTVTDFQIIDGVYYKARDDMFSMYIKYWANIKKNSMGALRQFAKLMLNNLYGKLATNPHRTMKIPFLEGNIVKYKIVENDSEAVHIACGSAITACARYELLTTAQANEPYLLYMDTDSIHMIKQNENHILKTPLAKIGKEIGLWDEESTWDEGYFIRAKTYCEHATKKGKTAWEMRGAGCPPRSKNLFLEAVDGVERVTDKSEKEKQWIKDHKLSMKDFNYGLSIPGKLLPKIVNGGTVLIDTYFTMNESQR